MGLGHYIITYLASLRLRQQPAFHYVTASCATERENTSATT